VGVPIDANPSDTGQHDQQMQQQQTGGATC
jgi:hypothetical protein